MNTKYMMRGPVLALVLAARLGQAEAEKIPVLLHAAGTVSDGLIDVNGDGHTAKIFVGVGTAHRGLFHVSRFLIQQESETSNRHISCQLPDGSTGEEHDLVQTHGIFTRESDGSQLFLTATAETLCLNISAEEVSIDLRGSFTGGTGAFAGASGTWEEKGSGQGVVADPQGHFFSHFSFDLTGTLRLP
jgi:hypothetical protein